MFVAVRLGVSVQIAYFSESKGWGGSGQTYTNAAMDTAHSFIKTIDAECSWEPDRKMIHADVAKLDRGFHLLDDVIYWVKVTSLIQSLHVHVGDMETLIETPFGVSSASCAGPRVNVAIASVMETWKKAPGSEAPQQEVSQFFCMTM